MFRGSRKERAFQQGFDVNQSRRNRLNTSLNLRKQERRQRLQKRRRRSVQQPKSSATTNPNASTAGNSSTTANTAAATSANVSAMTPPTGRGAEGDSKKKGSSRVLDFCIRAIQSDDPSARERSMTTIRELLSSERDPPIVAVLESGVVPNIIAFLDADPAAGSSDKLRFEAAWAMTNLLSGASRHVEQIVALGAIDALVKLLCSTRNGDIQSQCVWALGNVAGDRPAYKREMLRMGLMKFVVSKWHDFDQDTQKQALWVVSNLCRGDSRNTKAEGPHWANKKICVPLLAELLEAPYPDDDVLADCLWSLVYLTNESENCYEEAMECIGQKGTILSIVDVLRKETHKYHDSIRKLSEHYDFKFSSWNKKNNTKGKEAVKDDGDSKTDDRYSERLYLSLSDGQHGSPLNDKRKVREVLSHSWNKMNARLTLPAVRILGNLVTGPDEQTQFVLQGGYLDVVVPFLQSPSKLTRKEAFWTLSNILAGTIAQLQATLANQNVLRMLVHQALHDEYTVSKEALWCVNNALSTGNDAQVWRVRQEGCIEPLLRFLSHSDEKDMSHAMEGLDTLLAVLKKNEQCLRDATDEIEELGGLQRLEEIQSLDTVSDETYEKAQELVRCYWESEDPLETDVKEDDDLICLTAKMLAPKVNSTLKQFTFGINQAITNASGDGSGNGGGNQGPTNSNGSNGKRVAKQQMRQGFELGNWVF